MSASAAPAQRAVSLIHALVGGTITSVRVAGSRIVALGERPQAGDRVLDLEGDRLLPGLINAHDHLQLNSLPATGARRFRNVREWFGDVDGRRADPAFAADVAVPRDERLLLGGFKNLLSGVTTVAHHDPLYPLLTRAEFPTQVLQQYGWAHSLQISGEAALRQSCRDTPPSQPWIVHAAEGVDEEAAAEFGRLEELGCIGSNTLLVHGIALDDTQRGRLAQLGAGLIWCPASNLNLFGVTAQVAVLASQGRVALGTDSRMSGARDLLDELRAAAACANLDEPALTRMVTCDAARLLRLPDRGELRPGARADLLVLPADRPPGRARRADVRLVMIGGSVRYADAAAGHGLAGADGFVPIRVDGAPKVLDAAMALRWAQALAREPGVEWPSRERGAA